MDTHISAKRNVPHGMLLRNGVTSPGSKRALIRKLLTATEKGASKVTTMSFLGYLIQAKPPLNRGKMLRLTLNHFYHSFEA